MLKKIAFFCYIFVLSLGFYKNSFSNSNDVDVYVGFHAFQGIYNVREVNSATDRMPGFHIFSGGIFPVFDYLSLRLEGMYNHGYDHSPSTNYSSFTIRSGFELNGKNPVIIPYFLAGIGVVAYDPPRMDMQEGYVTSGTFGVKIPVGSGFSIDMALEYSYSVLDFVLVSGKTHLDRMGMAIGFVKTF